MSGLLDSVLDFVGGLLGDLADTILGTVASAINNFVGKLLYYVTIGILYIVDMLQSLFNVFAGINKVEYNNEKTYLINVFFGNKSVNNVYWAMALLGMVFVIMFTLIAVIRKMFDMGDKHQNQSMGAILGSMFKSILTMLLLTSVMSAAISLTNVLTSRISYIFTNADSFSEKSTIVFTDEQYATMARVYKTIGNYSLNPSYASRYNLNSCYNEIRADMQRLQQEGVFDFPYVTRNVNGVEVDTWQSVLQKIAYAADPTRELSMDNYHGDVSEALLHAMNVLKTNREFQPLSEYGKDYSVTNAVGLDKVLFLTGTMGAARNNQYNINPYMTDGLRGAFYNGEKNIYSFNDVKSAFDISMTGISYILIWVLSYFTLRNLLRCIFACISRIFNMVSLYIIAPLTVASMPIDDGEKFKQWTISMVVQALGVYGNIIPMHMIILFAPIILSPKLVVFTSPSLNFIAKTLLIVAGLQAMESFRDMLTGILANSAGHAAIRAGDQMGAMADSVFNSGVNGAKAVGRFGMKAAGYTVAAAGAAAGAVAAAGLAATGLAVAGVGAGAYQGGKAIYNKLRSSPTDQQTMAGAGNMGGAGGTGGVGGADGGMTGGTGAEGGVAGDAPMDGGNMPQNLSNMEGAMPDNQIGGDMQGGNMPQNLSNMGGAMPDNQIGSDMQGGSVPQNMGGMSQNMGGTEMSGSFSGGNGGMNVGGAVPQNMGYTVQSTDSFSVSSQPNAANQSMPMAGGNGGSVAPMPKMAGNPVSAVPKTGAVVNKAPPPKKNKP